MSESIDVIKENGWCKCCDGKDGICRCPHHWLTARCLIKTVLLFVAFGLVFGAGVHVGRFSSRRHGHFNGASRGYPQMMQHRSVMYGRTPMMYRRTMPQYFQQRVPAPIAPEAPSLPVPPDAPNGIQ